MAAVVGVVGMLAMATSARAADCSLADYDYNGACGPEYESPAWGDAAGWTDPSQYSTIQLADITGNGQDELLARNSDGLEIWRFDTSVGQWRPAIGANGLPEVLTDFRSPLPSEPTSSHGTNPMVYSTIQAAQVLGNGTESIVAQFPDGTHTYDYVPPASSKSIDGGNWLPERVSGPNGDLPPSYYLSMRVIGVQPNVTPAMLVFQNAFYMHSGPGTPGGGSWDATGQTTLAPQTDSPQYYLDNRAALWPVQSSGSNGPQLRPVNIYRTPIGIGWQIYDPNGTICSHHSGCVPGQTWGGVPNARFERPVGPFPDTESLPYHCYTENFDCFGDNPAWYETLRVANDLRGPGDEDGYVLGALSDGLHVYASNGSDWGSDWDTSIPVLKALNSLHLVPPSQWSSIRTGDVTGDGRTDVLALVDGQLQAWELKPNGSGGWTWSELPADVPLKLGHPFDEDASYYSTIQVGPVAGPGHPDAVIARGPFGIRTWFYCTGGASSVPGCASLQGKSGWTSWLPQGTSSYPQFTGGQGAAWTALNALAHNPPAPSAPLIAPDQATIRDVWTGSNPPTIERLTTLTNGLALAAGCSGQTSASPPAYTACKPPATSTGFTAADWTAVVNETLAEIYDAEQVVDYYATLGNLRRDIFLAEGAALPAIGSVVQGLAPAAGNSTEISPQSVFSTIFGISGAIAGAVFPENPAIGVSLAIASYVIAMIPSATPDVTSPPFSGTFGDLQNRFAASVGQADKAEEEQSYDVRQNWGLLQLVGQLTGPSGAWHTVDAVGMKSATEEGYVLSAYKLLLPTVYDRYVVRDCYDSWPACHARSWRGMVGAPPNFTTLEYPPNTSSLWHWTWTPCGTGTGFTPTCEYTNPPTDNVATQVWGPVSDTCNYTGDPATAWTYGDPNAGTQGCNLGVDPRLSVDYAGGTANGWNFSTCWVSPLSYQGTCESASGVASAQSQGSLQVSLATTLPRGFQVRSATLPADRVLFQPGAGGLLSPELAKGSATAASASGLGTIHLTTTNGNALGGAGGILLGRERGGPSAALILNDHAGGPPSHRLTALRLQLSGIRVAVPGACEQLPATVTLASPTFTLGTTLKLSNGHSTQVISRLTGWRCVRSSSGAVTTLRTVPPTVPAQRPGLAVSLSGPRAVVPGSVVVYTVRVRNMRRGPRDRDVSSLWNVQTQTGLSPSGPSSTRQIAELRRGKTRSLRISIRIPARVRNSAGHRVCVSVAATAASARPAAAQACAAIGSLPPGRG